MPETMEKKRARSIGVRYHGRKGQMLIYLGKFLRMFIYQSDWKVLPMSAFVAGLVGMVTKPSFFLTMEGTLMGAFALVMVCIWNGCFNSVQVICRERDVIKREHRSGMHISAYISAHMIYQALLCLMQTVITLYVTGLVGLRYDQCTPLFTPWFILDFGISVFLITFAADMMSLWISTLAHTTTAAMTVIPFVLIFQLVFSGGMLALPKWSQPLKKLTISAPGLNVVASQADYNHRPMVALWNKVQSMGDMEIKTAIRLDQVLDFLEENPAMAQELRNQELTYSISLGQAMDYLHDETKPGAKDVRDVQIGGTINMYQALTTLENTELYLSQNSTGNNADIREKVAVIMPWIEEVLKNPEAAEKLSSTGLSGEATVGELIDTAEEYGLLDQYRDRQVTISRTVGQLLDMVKEKAGDALLEKSYPLNMTVAELQEKLGVERVRVLLQEKAAEGSVKPEFEYTRENVVIYWLRLIVFVVGFAMLATVTLEFIDKDKR